MGEIEFYEFCAGGAVLSLAFVGIYLAFVTQYLSGINDSLKEIAKDLKEDKGLVKKIEE